MSDAEDFSVALNSQIFKKLTYMFIALKEFYFPILNENGRSVSS